MRVARLGIFALLLASVAPPGQAQSTPARWIGTWALRPDRSTFDAGVTLASQTLRITQTDSELAVAGDTVLAGGTRSTHDESRLPLGGQEIAVGPMRLSFRAGDASAFEVLSRVSTTVLNVTEVSRFVVSPDGATLTETKTRTDREAVPPGADQATAAVTRTSTVVLAFSRVR
jgi:hypothetical protein